MDGRTDGPTDGTEYSYVPATSFGIGVLDASTCTEEEATPAVSA